MITMFIMENVLYAVLISVEVLAATIIDHYDPTHHLRPEVMTVTPRAASCTSSPFADLATAKVLKTASGALDLQSSP